MTEYTPFDFIKSVSHTKQDIIKNDDFPEQIEKTYNGYIVNRGFSYFEDTILHANEMNLRPILFKDAQYRYYMGALRPRNRFSKWHKAEKNSDLDMIQEYYQCNRTVAKQYMKVLTSSDLKMINNKMAKGGT
jgi:hypothetical protein